jgi:hypothetical protein
MRVAPKPLTESMESAANEIKSSQALEKSQSLVESTVEIKIQDNSTVPLAQSQKEETIIYDGSQEQEQLHREFEYVPLQLLQ